MITIVSGKINSGKTKYLVSHYEERLQGDGYISKKILKGKLVTGYTSMRLSTKVETPWMIHSDFYQNEFKEEERIGPYHVNKKCLLQIESEIETMITKLVQPIYLDEIGRLELSNQGYDQILRKMIDSKLDIIISVRTDLVELVKKHYHIKDCVIISINS